VRAEVLCLRVPVRGQILRAGWRDLASMLDIVRSLRCRDWRQRYVINHTSLIPTMIGLLARFLVLATVANAGAIQQVPWSLSRGEVKVPVVLGVMSKCPDAILCEAVFDRVLKRVSDKIDLSLTYVAR
jgi:hypothetical protein